MHTPCASRYTRAKSADPPGAGAGAKGTGDKSNDGTEEGPLENTGASDWQARHLEPPGPVQLVQSGSLHCRREVESMGARHGQLKGLNLERGELLSEFQQDEERNLAVK